MRHLFVLKVPLKTFLSMQIEAARISDRAILTENFDSQSFPFHFTKSSHSSKLTSGFCGRNLCIVFDAFSPVWPIGFDEIKHRFIIPAHVRFTIFLISPINVQLPNGEVIRAIRRRGATLIGTYHTCSLHSSRPVMEINVILSGNYS
jgi:hypothetical protein